MKFLKKYAWYIVSGYLLILYLAYFHILNATSADQIKYVGAGFATAWLTSCFVFQACFRNRFEFAIHTLVTIDFYLESLIPFHQGYSFYYCAAGFWLIFLVYHHLPVGHREVQHSAKQAPLI